MSRHTFKKIFLSVFSAVYAFSSVLIAAPIHAAGTPNGSTLNTHSVMVDNTNKLVSWVANQDEAYGEVSKLAWEYLLGLPNQPNGKPAYYSYSYQDPNTQQPVGWPHNPAGLYGMLIESAVRYYQYSGDSRVLTVAQAVANHQLASGMTKSTDNWANVPYASGDAGSLTYQGASYGNSSGAGDGVGVIEPDKIAEFSVGLISLYKLTGNQTYLNAAITGADVLAAHIRPGNTTQSPWPYRVYAANNSIREQYGSNMAPYLELFDELSALNAGNVATYQSARTATWNWTLAYPMQNNNWSGYFEDVPIQSSPDANLNQLNAMMMARYLLLNPDKDPSWETHVRGLIAWVEQNFGQTQFGALTIKEQQAFFYAMGSHTSRYAEINALLYEKTGDTAAKEKAYRSFNWATYMARTNGVVIDGPQVNNQWFTDGYGDYIRHFMIGMGAAPEWAPNGQNHLLETTSLVNNVSYANPNAITYQTFDTSGIEKIKVNRAPSAITVNGATIAQRSDLGAQGWIFDATTSTISIRRDSGANAVITLSGTPINQAPSVSLTSPTQGASFIAPATVTLTANASDPEGALQKVEFYQNGTLLVTDTSAPFTTTVTDLAAGNYIYTAKAYDDASSTTSSPVSVSVGSQATGWTSQDIGSVGVAGSSTVTDSVFTVKGSGVDIWDNADSFQFQYVNFSGDGEIKARVATQQNTDQWALAGVMIRDNLNSGSRHVLAAATPINGLSFDWRSSENGSTNYVNGGNGAAPYWLRLTRAGNLFTAYKSTNGVTWTSMGSTTIAMNQNIYAGLAVTSHNNSTLGTATFDNVAVTSQAAGGDTTAPVISGVTSGAINLNGGSISWTTNEPATSQIEYGTTTAYGTSSPLNTTLETSHSQVVSGLQPGTLYHYRVKSTDAAGNTATSSDYTFTTQSPPDTTAPSTPTNVTAQALSTTSARITWSASTDNVGVSSYIVRRGGAVVGTTSATSFDDSSLTPGQTYDYTVTASDAAGNTSTASTAVSVTLPAPDTQAPSVSLTAPIASITVSGTITVSATASDNIGVVGVQFQLDGVNLSSEDTTSPYQISWNTQGASNGTHTLRAIARDAAGNTATSQTITVTVQNTVVISPNLVAAYNFDEGTGTTLADRTNKNHSGTLSGASWSTAGKTAGALSFNGSNNYVTIADADDLDFTTNLTLEAWIRPTSVSSWRNVIMKETTNGLSYALYAGSANNRASFYGRYGSNENGLNGTTNTPTNTWTHLAATYDGITMRLYVNGSQVSTRAQTGAIATSSGALRIGGNSVWGEYFSGLIDDVRIYNKALTATEIQTDMNTSVQ